MEQQEYDDFIEIDITKYLKKIKAAWKPILIIALCGGVFGGIIGLTTPKKYTSTAIVAPELVTRATTGSLSSLASLAGLNTNTVGMTDAMHPDLYPVVIKSSSFLSGLFEMPVSFEHKDTLVNTTFYDYMLKYQKGTWYMFILNSPKIALSAVRSIFSKKDEDLEGLQLAISPNGTLTSLTKEQEKVMRMISKCIDASVEKKTYVLNISVTLQNPDIAAQLAQTVMTNLTEFVVNYRTSKARETVKYYQNLYDESRENYLAAEKEYAEYVDSHHGVVSQTSLVEKQHLQNEYNLRYQLYNSMAQNLLSAQSKVSLESPVLVTVQSPLPPHKGSPSTTKIAFVMFFLAACGAAVVYMVKK